MTIILHITQHQQWEQAKQEQVYHSDTLATEGFIHCSTPVQVIQVANRFFLNQDGLVILCIDTNKVLAEIKYESADGDYFPHIYGSLNVNSVIKVIDFPPNVAGKFEMSEQIKALNFL